MDAAFSIDADINTSSIYPTEREVWLTDRQEHAQSGGVAEID